jgi:regulator of protease activity HflC (stomatin/prohibitin superfamily)
MDWIVWVLLLGPLFQIIAGIRIVPESQRFVVLRLGRFHRVLQPGLRWVLPGIDEVLHVQLNASVPDWQSLSESDLHSRLRELTVTGLLAVSTD